MEKSEWIKKAAEQYRKNGLFEKNDGLISKDESLDWASQVLSSNEELLEEDPAEVAKKSDISNWFGGGKDD